MKGWDEDSILIGEIKVSSDFVRGSLETWVLPEDLEEWESALSALRRGENVAWREGNRAPEIRIEVDSHSSCINVSVFDSQASLVAVKIPIEVENDWIYDHYQRLTELRKHFISTE